MNLKKASKYSVISFGLLLIVSSWTSQSKNFWPKKTLPFLATKAYGKIIDPYESIEIDTVLKTTAECLKTALNHFEPKGEIGKYYKYTYDKFGELKSRFDFDKDGDVERYSKLLKKYSEPVDTSEFKFELSQEELNAIKADGISLFNDLFFDSITGIFYEKKKQYQYYFDKAGEIEGTAESTYKLYQDREKIDAQYIYDHEDEIFSHIKYIYDPSGLLLYKHFYDYRNRLKWYETYLYDNYKRLQEIRKYDSKDKLKAYQSMAQEALKRWADSLHNSFINKAKSYKKYHYLDSSLLNTKIEAFNEDGEIEISIEFDYDGLENLIKKSIFDKHGKLLNYITAEYDCENLLNKLQE